MPPSRRPAIPTPSPRGVRLSTTPGGSFLLPCSHIHCLTGIPVGAAAPGNEERL